MATAKKIKPAAIAPALKPLSMKLDNKAISAKASGTPEARETAKLLLEI
jgi:orotate phosphoribosyltransferase